MERLFRTHLIRLLITSVFFVAACLGLWYVHTSMKTKGSRVVEVKQHLASYEQNKKTFLQETARFKKIEERVGHIEKYRITLATVPNLLSSIESQAAQQGITFTITAVDAPKKPGDNQELAIEFLANGSIGQIESFVNTMQSQPYEISFSKFSLYRDTQQSTTTPTVPVGQWQLLGRMKIISF